MKSGAEKIQFHFSKQKTDSELSLLFRIMSAMRTVFTVTASAIATRFAVSFIPRFFYDHADDEYDADGDDQNFKPLHYATFF